MANIKFTQLPNLSTPTADTIVPVVKSNVNYTVTTDTLTAYVNNNSDNITATGNITAAFFSGNGSALTSINGSNVAGAVANATYAVSAGTATTAATANSVAGANVSGTVANATYATSSGTAQYVTANAQANITSVGILTSLSASGNITGNYFIGNGSALTGLGATYSNANATSLMANFGSNIISTSGNITGGYILGNGSQLSGLPATYGNANVVTLLAGFGSNAVSTTGNITAGYLLGNGSQLSGLPATYGNSNVVTLLSAFGSNTVSTTGNVTASYVIGNGSTLTNLTGANVSGTVGNATFATSAGTAATANTAATAVTVTQAAQTAITSVGTLTSLNVSGNITSSATIGGNTYSELTSSQGSTGSSVTPVFSNGSVQKFTANANFTLNAPTGIPTGGSVTLIITQDATGSRVMTPNAVYKFAYSLKTLSTAANSIDVMSIFYDGSDYLCNLVKGYTA